MTSVKFLKAEGNDSNSKSPYSERNAKIGSIKLNDATKVIDAIEYTTEGYKSYSDLAVTTIDVFVDETEYEAYGFGTKVDGIYPLVLVVEGVGAYNATTRFAVVTDGYNESTTDDGDEIFELPVLYNGEATVLSVSDEAESQLANVKRGDAIFFQTGSDGYIDEIDVIFSFGGTPDYDDLLATLKPGNDVNVVGKEVVYPMTTDENGDPAYYTDYVTDWYTTKSDAVQLVFGPVMESNSSYFTLGSIKADGDKYITNKLEEMKAKSDGGYLDIGTTSDTKVYVFDYSASRKADQMTVGTVDSILESTFIEDNNDSNGDVIVWNNKVDGEFVNHASVNFAFAKVVDGDATDVFVFLAK